MSGAARAPVMAYPFVSSFSAKVGALNRPMPGAAGSFLSLEGDNLQIVVFKEAEDGDGYILRFREIANRSGDADLQFPTMRLKEAWLCNGVEANKLKLASTPNSVRVPYTPNQYVTVRLKGESALRQVAAR